MYKALIAILLVLIVAGSIFHMYQVNKLEEAAVEHQNQLAKTDTVRVIDEEAVAKYAMQLNEIKLENSKLKQVVKSKNTKIRDYTKITGQLQAEIKDIKTRDSVFVDSVNNIMAGLRKFNVEQGAFSVAGNFMKKEPWKLNLTSIKAALNLEVLLVEKKNKSWETFVATNDPQLKISAVDTRVSPYKKPWYEQVKAGVGAMGGKEIFNCFGMLGYKKTAVTLGYTTGAVNSPTVGVVYLIN